MCHNVTCVTPDDVIVNRLSVSTRVRLSARSSPWRSSRLTEKATPRSEIRPDTSRTSLYLALAPPSGPTPVAVRPYTTGRPVARTPARPAPPHRDRGENDARANHKINSHLSQRLPQPHHRLRRHPRRPPCPRPPHPRSHRRSRHPQARLFTQSLAATVAASAPARSRTKMK